MKYILFEDFAGESVPIIFPNRIDFAEFREQIPYSKVLAAGYIQLRGKTFACHGESKSLETRSRPGDAALIQARFQDPEV